MIPVKPSPTKTVKSSPISDLIGANTGDITPAVNQAAAIMLINSESDFRWSPFNRCITQPSYHAAKYSQEKLRRPGFYDEGVEIVSRGYLARLHANKNHGKGGIFKTVYFSLRL